MARTVSNSKRNIVTRGTGHVAVATAADLCALPNGTVVGFTNWVKSDKLQRATTRTVIAGEPVWTRSGQLGPPSEPPHAGVKGTRSGTHHKEAKAASYSKDVFVEQNAAVRAFDLTTQNHENTDGIVLPSELFAMLNALNGFDGYCLADAALLAMPFLNAAGKL